MQTQQEKSGCIRCAAGREAKGLRETKFSMNALVLVVILFSAITFFFTIRMVDLATMFAVNEYYPIEGTDLAVRYSSLYPYGIYEGERTTAELKVEGTFGYDWGAAVEGDRLFINEYTHTEMGLMLTQLVRIDLNTFEKTPLREDTMLKGRCASGELVCVEDFLISANFPKTNALCDLYAFSSDAIRPEGNGATVLFLDPDSGEVLYRVWDDEALTDGFDARYLARTLEEVRG